MYCTPPVPALPIDVCLMMSLGLAGAHSVPCNPSYLEVGILGWGHSQFMFTYFYTFSTTHPPLIYNRLHLANHLPRSKRLHSNFDHRKYRIPIFLWLLCSENVSLIFKHFELTCSYDCDFIKMQSEKKLHLDTSCFIISLAIRKYFCKRLQCSYHLPTPCLHSFTFW